MKYDVNFSKERVDEKSLKEHVGEFLKIFCKKFVKI